MSVVRQSSPASFRRRFRPAATAMAAVGLLIAFPAAAQTLPKDDDKGVPTLSIDSPTVAEDNSAGTLTFTVTLSAASPKEVVVNYADAGTGTATAETDYTAFAAGKLVFAANETAKTIVVSLTDDNEDESDETVVVSLSGAENATIGTGTGTGTITDDDAASSLSIDSPTVLEGDDGSATLTFTVTLNPASSKEVTVEIADAGTGSATAGADYTAVTATTLTFAAGDTSKTFSVSVTSDTTDESNETVVLTLGKAANATIAAGTGTGTITDDDGTPVASIDSPSVTEGDSGTATLTFTVSLSSPSSKEVTVNYAEGTGGTATSGTDYTALAAGTLTFAAGDTSRTVTVTVHGDTLPEADETIPITLSEPKNATLGTATGTGTITDDESAPTISIGSATVTEGNGASAVLSFPVTLSAASGAEITVDYEEGSDGTATADTDYLALKSGTLTFAAAETSKTITVSVIGDRLDEPDETVSVKLRSPTNATIAAGTATGTITDDDAPPTVSLSSPTVAEGDTGSATLTFVASLSAASGREITVDYAPATSGTATAGTDYTALAGGTLTLAAGVTRANIEVSVTGDAIDEANETVVVKLSGPVNATLGTATGTGTITDDDATPTVALAVTPTSISENAGTATVSATLSSASGEPTTITVPAHSLAWSVSADASITIPAGSTGNGDDTVTLTAIDNSNDEADRTFTVTGSASNALGIGAVTGARLTLTDDDDAPVGQCTVNGVRGHATLTPATISENGGTATVTAKILDAAADATEVEFFFIGPTQDTHFSVSGDGAKTTGVSWRANFPAGSAANTTRAITITGLDNSDFGARTLRVVPIFRAGGASCSSFDLYLTLQDDDSALVVGAVTGAATEAGGTAAFTVKLASAPSASVALSVSSTDPGEGTVSPSRLTFTTSDWNTPQTVTATGVDDARHDGEPAWAVRLGRPSTTDAGYARLGSRDVAMTTADDEETPTVTLSASPSSISENGGTATVSAALSGASDAPTTITVAAVSGAFTVGSDTTITIPRGRTANSSDTVTVTAVDNRTDEVDRAVTVAGTAANTVGIGTVTGAALTLEDDDGAPTVRLAASPATIAEGGQTQVSATLSAPWLSDVVVQLTARTGVFSAAMTTITIPAGATTSTERLSVRAIDNTADEPDLATTVEGRATYGPAGSPATVPVAGAALTITDNDEPYAGRSTVSIRGNPATEASAGTGTEFTIRFVVSLNLPASPDQPVSVDYYIREDLTTATEGEDYRAGGDFSRVTLPGVGSVLGGTLAIPVSSTSAVLELTGLADSVSESTETVAVQLVRPRNAWLGTASIGRASITDMPQPVHAFGNIHRGEQEGDDGRRTLRYTVWRSNNTGNGVATTVDYADAGTGTATSGTDYVAVTPGTLTFAALDQRKDIEIALIGDRFDEEDETIVLQLSNPTNGVLQGGGSTLTATGASVAVILDDDPLPALSIGSPSAFERNNSVLEFPVTLNPASGRVVTVGYWDGSDTQGGTATRGVDYRTVAPGTLTFAAGETEKTITVPIFDDHADEGNETVEVFLRHPGNATIRTATGTGTIVDDDGNPKLSILPARAFEGDDGSTDLTFTVRLSPASGQQVTVDYADAGTGTATAGTDYTPLTAGTLTFAAGDTGKTVTVSVIGDTLVELDETVVLQLSDATNTTIATATATGVIVDDESAPTVTLSLSPASISEGGASNASTVTAALDRASPVDTTITVSAAPGTNAAAGDFSLSANPVLTIAAGATASTGTVTVSAVDDRAIGPNRNVTVSGSAVNSRGVTGPREVTLAIVDDDGEPTLSIDSPTVTEGDDGGTALTFTVSLNVAHTEEITVRYADVGDGSATSGTDYGALTAEKLTFAPGDLRRTVTVSVAGDTTDEPDETIVVKLGAAVNAAISSTAGTGTGTIRDDDDAPTVTLALSPASIAESGASNASTVKAGLDHPSSAATTITVGAAAGANAESGDFSLSADRTLTIAAGATTSTGTVTVTAVDDSEDEPDKSVTVSGSATNARGITEPAEVTLTITDDDDAPTLSVDSPSVTEGDSGSATLVFTVTLSAASAREITVDYADAETGTATSGTDYSAIADGTLTFAAGETAKTIAVSVTGDTTDEPNETVAVALSSPTNATVSSTAGTGTGTITDDDDAPTVTLALSAASIAESGASNASTVTASLDHPSGAVTTITVGAAAGTNAGSGDFSLSSNATLTIAAGATASTGTVTVTAVDDTEDGPDKSVTVSGSATNTQGITDPSDLTLTITDDDDEPSLSIGPASVTEGDSGSAALTFTVSLSAASRHEITVDYADAGSGTATSGTDYTALADGTLTFAAGDTSKTVTVAVTGDTTDEPNETVGVTLSGATNATISTAAGTGTITDDDDAPTVTLALSPVSIAEGGASNASTVTASLDHPSSAETTITVGAAAGTNAVPGDFSLSSNATLTIAAGATSSTGVVTVTAVDNTADEPDKSVTVSGTATNTQGITQPSAVTLAVTDDDDAPTLSIGSASVTEGDSGSTNLTFTVNLSAASGRQVTVQYADAGSGTATSGTDYTALTGGTLTFAAGDTSKTVTVSVTGDTTDEPNETVAVALSSPTNATVSSTAGSGTGTITDDDDAPAVTLALSRTSIAESGATNSATVTASLDRASSAVTTITVSAAADTNAVPGDFSLSSSTTLTIAAGSTSSTGTVTVTAVDNTADEPDKSVTVSGSAANSQGITQPSAVTLSITDDDDAPTLSIDSPTVTEGDSSSTNLTFTVTLNPASGRQVTVAYADAGTGSATSGTDYTALSGGTLTFAAGDTTKTVTVSVTGDTTDEPNETVALELSGATNAAISTAKGTGTITDDDAVPTVTLALSRTSIAESGATNAATVTASLDRASSAETTITVSAAAGTNAVPGDFSLSGSTTLTIAAGSTSSTGTVTVTAVDNTADEPDKSVTVSGSATNSQGITQPSSVTLAITDDDDAPTLSIGPTSVTEGDSGSTNLTFTVTLSPASGRQVTVQYADAGTGSATSGTDYTALSGGTLTFAAGDTSKTVTVSVTGDTADEPNETVVVTLSGPTNAGVSSTADTGTGTITDDDAAPTVTLSLSPTSIAESGSSNASTVTASLDHPSSAETAITVGAAAGTNAVPGDFSLSSSTTLTIAAGSTSSTGTVTVTAVNNSADEPDKSVTVSGSAANSQGITQPSAVTLSITDDDDAPTLSIDSPTVTEGDSGSTNLTFTVTLSPASGRQVTVAYADAGTGSATSGTDYTALSGGTLTFAAGDTSKTFSVAVTGDTTDEPNETVVVALSSPTNATVSSTAGTGTGTITDDDDAPTVTLALSRTSIAESGATNSTTVTASLDRASSAATTVTVSAAAGTNAVSGDFSLSSNKTLTIAAGSTDSTGVVTVTAVDNTADEPDKNVTVSGSAANSQGITQPSAVTLAITDDDGAPNLSIDSPTVTEGDSGSANLTFTVTLSPASGRQVTVQYADAGSGTATAGEDYTALTGGTLTFAAGDTSKTVTVSVTGDTTDEPNETVSVALSGATNATISTAAGTGTITDDDDAPTVTLALSRTSVTESGAANAATVTASLDRASSAATTITVSAAAGMDTAPGDFSLSGSTTLTIAAGSTSSTGVVTVTAVNNTADEPDKSVTVSATATNTQGITQPSAVTLAITDDDGAPTLAIDSPTVTEGDSGSTNLTFTVTLNPASGREVTVGYADGTGTATAGEDYTALTAGTLTFAAGDTSKTVTVSVTGDTTDEPNETVLVALSSPTNATVSSTAGTGTGTITDDDDAPTVTLALSRTSIAESGATNSTTVTASLDRASSAATTVTVSAAAGTNAVSGDFSLSSNKTLTIAAGSTDSTGVVTVTAVDNTADEPDKNVTVSGSAANSQGITQPSAVTLAITDDDGAPNLSIDSPTVTEGDSGSANLTFTVTLSPASGRQVTVQYADAGSGTATAGEDYTALTGGTLTFAAGDTSKTVTVSVTGDTTDEPNETVAVALSSPTNATVSSTAGTGTGTITDDDDAPTVTLALSRSSIAESGSTNSTTVTASLDRASSAATTITVSAAAGTDTVAGDFSLSGSTTLTIAAGSTSSTGVVTVTAVNNTADESDKSVTVSATATNTQGIIQPSAVTLAITDDDGAPTLSIGSASVAEGDSGSANLTFTVTLSPASGRQVTVGYADAGTGTATSGTDYTALTAGTLTFAAGDTSKTVTVSVTGDTTDEPNETVLVALSSPTNAAVSNTAGTGTGTITDDDDAPTVTLALSRTSIAESGATNSTTVTASLDRASSAATTVTVSAAAGTNAVSGDFSLSSNKTLTIAAGSTDSTGVVTVTAVDNTADEPDKNVTVSGSAANSQGITQPSAVTLAITDDDSAPTLSIDSPTVTEGDSGSTNLTFTVTLNPASGRQVTVQYADPRSGTATSGTDYTALTGGTLTFAAGDTSKTVTVSVTGDTTDEPNETVLVALSSPTNATVSSTAGTGTGTITDDDDAPTVTLALSRTSIAESGTTNSATVTASLDRASSAATTITVSAAAGTNAVPGDFSLSSSTTLTIAAGSTSSTGVVTVTAVNNTADESDKSVTVSATATNTQGIIQPSAVTLAITDDDGAPTLSIGSASVAEGDSGSANLTFTVTLSPASGRQVTVGYADAGTGTATSGTDYTALTAGTLTFAAGDTSKTVTVSVTGDTTDEPNETVQVTLSGATNSTISTATGTGTITDDDNAPTVTLALSRTAITESGATNSATVTASLDRASSAVTNITVSAAAGTDTVAGDFSLSSSKTLTIAAGNTSSTGTVTVTAVDNTVDEPDKSVTVSGSAANSQGIIQPSAVTLAITDDDGAPTLSIDSPTVTEGDSGSINLTFTVTLSPASGRQVTVQYADAGTGSATSGTDYTALTAGTLTFAAGDTSKTVTVSVTGDTTDEPNETVQVTLSGPTNAAMSATAGTGTGTITDDDAIPKVTLALSRTSITESGANNSTTVTASLDRASSAATTVTVSATAGTDAVSGDFSLSGNKTLTIAAGSTSSTGEVTVTAVDNTRDEPDKSVTVSGSASNTQGITQPAGVTLAITDDDGAPTLSIGSVSVAEGDSGSANLTFTVTLSPASGREVTVGYADAGTGTATSGTDYTALTAGTLTFAAGDTSKTVTVAVTGDTTDEPNETVLVALSSPTNATVSSTAGTGTGTITDDDDAPTVTLALSRSSIAESGSTNSTTVTASLDRASSAATTITVSAAAGTDTVAGDFSLSGSTTLTIAAGNTSSTGAVTVTAVDNPADEPDKSVTVSATATNTQGITQPSAVTLAIADDDGAPTLSIDSPSVDEGDSGAATLTFTVSLSAASARRVTVDYTDAGTGTATSGTDYTALSDGTLTFAAGDTSKTITVSVTGDTTDETNETIEVELSGATNAAISTAKGTGTITDDDAAPTVTLALSPTSIAESGSANASTVTASLDRPSSAATTITVGATAGTNAGSGDFSLSSQKTLTIAAGATTSIGTVTITAVDDSKDGPDKSVTVSGSATNTQGIADPSDLTLTITDDDGAPTLSIDSPSVNEGDSGAATLTFTVSLSAASARQVTVDYADAGTGTATSGTDYTAITDGTLTFAAGETSKTVTVSVTGDTTDEPDETVEVTLSGAANAAVSTTTGTGTITDDDDAPTVTLALSRTSVTESGANNSTTVTASLDRPSSAATTVTVAAAAGTDTVPGDFSLSSTTLTIAAGSTSSTGVVTVTAVDNTRDEPDKSVTVSGSAANSQGITQPSSVTLAITDDDDAPALSSDAPTLSIDSPSVAEEAVGETSTLRFTVTLSPASGQQVTVGYADDGTGTATAGEDYAALTAGTLTFAAGETTQTIDVTVTGDDEDEPAETVVVALSSPTNAAVSSTAGTGTGTITDAGAPARSSDAPALSIDSPSEPEGDRGSTNLTFTVTLSPASSRPVTVNYADAGTGTATSGEDYAALPPGTLTFAAGETARTIAVSVTGDTAPEPDETVAVRLSNPSNAVISSAAGTGTGTIANDDAHADSTPVTPLLFEAAVEDRTWVQGRSIQAFELPAARGGRGAVTYALEPALPPGVERSGFRVSGASAETRDRRTHRWTATDDAGRKAVLFFDVEVVAADRRPVFEYGILDQTYRTGKPIRPLTLPTAAGGDGALRYTLSPTPPEGLTWNARWRTLSGTPLSPQEPTPFTWTATDADGDATRQTFTIEVSPDPAPRFEAEGPALRFRAGRRIEPRALPAAVGGDPPLRYALRPSAPAGLRFDAGSRRLSGTPAGEQAATPYTLVATDADGDEATLDLTIAVDGPAAVLRATLRIVSRPARGDTYGYGEKIALEVVFSEPVTVTGMPELTLTVGARRRPMVFRGDTGSRLRFEYAVAGDDRDDDGVSVAENALTPRDGAIENSTAQSAELHQEHLGDRSGHKVDGSPRAAGSLPPLRLVLGGPPARVDLSGAFAGAETYEAESSAPSVATVSVEGTAAIVTAVVEGTAAVTVRGRNPGGEAAQSFEVTVATAPAEREAVSSALAGLGRSLLAGTSATVGRRLEDGGTGGSRLTVAGQSVRLDGGSAVSAADRAAARRQAAARAHRDGSATEDGLSAGSEFALSFGGAGGATAGGGDERAVGGDGRAGARWTVWGAGDAQSFQGGAGSGSTWAGRPATAWVGADVERGHLLAGVAVARTAGDLDYTFTEGAAAGNGALSTRLLTVQPYGRWRPDRRTSVWGVGGVGSGAAALSRSVTRTGERADLGLVLGLAGVRRELGSRGGFTLALRGDAGRVRLAASGGGAVLSGLAASAYRTRVGVEVTGAFRGGLSLAPFAAVNSRWDGGADLTGTGLEVAAGLRVADGSGRVEVETRGRLLVTHTAAGYRERGASVTARLTPGGDDRGLQLALAPRWGAAATGADALWQEQAFGLAQAGGGPPAAGALDARVGYGFGLLAPFAEAGWAERQSRRLRLGALVGGIDAPLDIEVTGERHETGDAPPALRFSVLGYVQF